MNRREFLASVATAVAVSSFPDALTADDAPHVLDLTLTIAPSNYIRRVPLDYTGLSYESAQLGHPSFFAPSNGDLLAFMRRLGDRGVLRIGGNTSEFTLWSPGATADSDESAIVGPDTGRTRPRTTVITKDSIKNLAGFVDMLGWKLIYGLNLGNGTPEQAADEAQYVAQELGDRLLCFQIGNEPDLYPHNDLRPPQYDYPDYFAEWERFVAAVRATVPKASFAGPDVAGRKWIDKFAAQAHSDAVLISGHYYVGGPPSNPKMTIDYLLAPNENLATSVAQNVQAATVAGLPFRMTEGNSCYGGGKQGLSDTFASALWGADYMLMTAAAGYVGVNFHGGGNGWYTPIAGSIDAGFSARPLYYGMLLSGQFAGATLMDTNIDTQGANVTAYAGHFGRKTLVALFNKDQVQTVRVSFTGSVPAKTADVWRLTAPAAASTDGVTLAGMPVGSDAVWSPLPETALVGVDDRFSLILPPTSAALIHV